MLERASVRMRDAYVWSEAIKDGIVGMKALTGGDKSVDGFVGVLQAIEALLETAEAPEEELAMDSPEALEVVASAFQGLVGAKAPVVHGQDLSVHLLKDVRVASSPWCFSACSAGVQGARRGHVLFCVFSCDCVVRHCTAGLG